MSNNRANETRNTLRRFLLGPGYGEREIPSFGTDDGWECDYDYLVSELDPYDLIELVLFQEDFKKLSKMPYDEFLKTNYWGIISEQRKNAARRKCDQCGSFYQLNVHHKTYKHRGYEIEHFGDLVVLCRSCHGARHGK